VVETLNRLVARHRPPKYVFLDNGSEFTRWLMDMWAYHHGVRLDFSRPGKPTDNSYVETFNGSLRHECLNVHWFKTLAEAKQVLEAWRKGLQREPSSQFSQRHDAGRIRP
jgi:putative transposase